MPRGLPSLQWRYSLQLRQGHRVKSTSYVRFIHSTTSRQAVDNSSSKSSPKNADSVRPSMSDRERAAFERVFKTITRAESKKPRPFTSESVQKAQETVQRFPQ